MEVAARNPICPVQYGGSSTARDVRPEPSRRREAEEQLGGDVFRARLQDPEGVVRTAEEALQQPREELEYAVDSICKHIKELGALQIQMSERFSCQDVRRSSGAYSASSQVRLWTCGMVKTWPRRMVAGRRYMQSVLKLVIGSPPSGKHPPWIKDEREAPLQGIKHLNFCCAVYRRQTERGVHFLHEHP